MIQNDSGVIVLDDTRNVLVLLARNSFPSGTLMRAYGAGGATYAFGLPAVASTYGLQTRSPAGELMFDAISSGRMARPVGVMTGNIPGSTLTQTVTRTFPSGRTYAVGMIAPVSPLLVRNVAFDVGGNMNYRYALDDQEMSVSISGGTVSVTATRSLGNPQGVAVSVPYDTAGRTDWRALVLDVTNF